VTLRFTSAVAPAVTFTVGAAAEQFAAMPLTTTECAPGATLVKYATPFDPTTVLCDPSSVSV